MKKKDIFNAALILFVFLLVFIPLYTLIINKIIISNSSLEVVIDSVWVGYYGSILSGIIAGLITIAGVGLTLRYYMIKDEEEERKKHLPYIRVSRLTQRDKLFWTTVYFEGSSDEKQTEYTCPVEVSNIGLGTAIDVKIKKIIGNKNPDQSATLNLMPKENTSLTIVFYLIDIEETFKIEIEFNDIRGNTYEQYFTYDTNKSDVVELTEPELILEN